jgi:Tfp pilus assembly protein PilV
MQNQKSSEKRQQHQRGQSLVEAALTLPVVLMLMLGLLDFGRAYYAIVALRDAADEGASYASIAPKDIAGIRVRASEASQELVPVEPNDVRVTYPPALSTGEPITVTIVIEMELYTPFSNLFVSDSTLEIKGQSTHPIIEIR